MSFLVNNNSVEELTDAIRQKFYDLENQNESLKNEIAVFNKDEKIEELTKQIRHILRNSLMNMSDKEYEADKEFRSRHWEMHNGGKYKNGGNTYLYELSGTGIGTCIKIKCPICGEEKDITDIGSW